MPMQMNEYNDTLTAMIIKRIAVQNAESVKVWFDCGMEMDESL